MAIKKLTPKQERFVQEYMIDLNAAAAYLRAGYKASEEAARRASSRLLTNVDIRQAIAAAQAKHAGKLEIDAQTILREYARIALSEMGQILDFPQTDPRLRPANEIPEDARRAIAFMKVKRHIEGTGEEAREVEVIEFRLWDKLNALEKLGKHLGLLKDQVDVSIRQLDQLIESELARLAGKSQGEAPRAAAGDADAGSVGRDGATRQSPRAGAWLNLTKPNNDPAAQSVAFVGDKEREMADDNDDRAD